jgi:hypothetical protein
VRATSSALIALQGLVLVGLGIFLAVRGFGSDTASIGRAELAAGLAVVAGVLFGALARGLLVGQTWVRTPTLLLEALCLPVAWGLFQAHKYWFGVPVGAVPALTLVLLIASGVFAPAREEHADR